MWQQKSNKLLISSYGIVFNKDSKEENLCICSARKSWSNLNGLLMDWLSKVHQFSMRSWLHFWEKMCQRWVKSNFCIFSMPANTRIQGKQIFSLKLFKNWDLFLASSVSSRKLPFCWHTLCALSLLSWAKKYKEGEDMNSHKK